MNYLTISPNSICTTLSANKYTKIDGIKSHHLIAATYNLDRELIIKLDDLIRNIRILNLKKVIIIYILKCTQDEIDKNFQGIIKDTLEIHFLSFDSYTDTLNSSNFNFNLTNKHCLYIFNDVIWSKVVLKFKSELDATVSGGRNVKRHMLSPLHLRFSSYILAIFNLNSPESINHNAFNSIDKNIYLPCFDMSNKSKIIYTID